MRAAFLLLALALGLAGGAPAGALVLFHDADRAFALLLRSGRAAFLPEFP